MSGPILERHSADSTGQKHFYVLKYIIFPHSAEEWTIFFHNDREDLLSRRGGFFGYSAPYCCTLKKMFCEWHKSERWKKTWWPGRRKQKSNIQNRGTSAIKRWADETKRNEFQPGRRYEFLWWTVLEVLEDRKEVKNTKNILVCV